MQHENRGGVYNAHLVHPDERRAYPARVAVSRRGIAVERTGGAPLVVRWYQLQGLCADESRQASDGRFSQIVDVTTKSGTLQLYMPAVEVSKLFGDIRLYAASWALMRHPLMQRCGPALFFLVTLWHRAMSSGGHRSLAPFRFVVRHFLAPVARAIQAGSNRVTSWISGTFVGLAAKAVSQRMAPHRKIYARIGIASLVAALVVSLVVVVQPPKLSAHTHELTSFGTVALPSMSKLAKTFGGTANTNLAPANNAPSPTPAKVLDEPPLVSHEVYGFAPYWTLGQSSDFDVEGLTTIAYFSVGVSGDGSLIRSGPGWQGYESQDLVDLVNRAHAAGDRVVITVNCFSQGTLDELTSTPTAPKKLSNGIVTLITTKQLDGVNIDFEGNGAQDQTGLTNLITLVSTAVHAANSHFQVTMDTYASSAGDSGGFYNIPALENAVDGFFIMSYGLNLQGTPNASSPLTSTMFSDATTLRQYAAVVTPAKIILGVPFYGYQWPTTNGTLAAHANGGAVPLTYATIVAKGTPSYWDDVTDTGWTSYKVHGQWYEDYYEDPTSIYMIDELASQYHIDGMGAWALGMDGNNPEMLGALDGFAPAEKPGPAGPASTSPSTSPNAPTAPGTSTPPASTTTTTVPKTPSKIKGTKGVFNTHSVTLTRVQVSTTPTQNYRGELTGFQSTTSSLACLSQAPYLNVWSYKSTSQYVVIANQPTDCIDAEFSFTPPTPPTTKVTTAKTVSVAPHNVGTSP